MTYLRHKLVQRYYCAVLITLIFFSKRKSPGLVITVASLLLLLLVFLSSASEKFKVILTDKHGQPLSVLVFYQNFSGSQKSFPHV